MNIFKYLIVLLLVNILFLAKCTTPETTNPYDPGYELPAPSNFDIAQETLTSCALTWTDNAEGEEGYRIERKSEQRKISTQKGKCETKGDWERLVELDPNTEQFPDEDVMPGYTYIYRVYAFAGENESNKLEKEFIVQFNAPSGFNVKQTSLSSCKLNWNDNSEGEYGFIIDRKVDGGFWEIGYADVEENINEFDDTEVLPESIYTYRIYGFIEGATSSKIESSAEIIFAEPTDLYISQDNVHTFILTWNYPTDWPEGYKIDRKIDDGEWEQEIGLVNDVLITLWADDTVGRNYTTVYYRMYAYWNDYTSNKVEGNSNIEFDAPTNLNYDKVTINSIKLSWQDNSDGESGFKIDKKVGASSWVEEYGEVSENDTTWTDIDVEVNEDLQYSVYAYCGDNTSNSIETDLIDNTIPAPENLSYEIENGNDVHLYWEYTTSGIDGFTLERKVDDESWAMLVNNLSPDLREYLDEEISMEDHYSYRVLAYYGNYEPSYSIEIVVNSIPTNGLVAYYPFNGNANDESGNGHNGDSQPNVDFSAVDRFGNSNSAIYIGSSYITIPENVDLNLQSHTISAWSKFENGHTGSLGGIFNNGYNYDHYALCGNNSLIRSWINYPNSPDDEHIFNTTILEDEEYHHLAATYNFEIRTLWIDGNLVSTMVFNETINYSNSENCYIGINFPGGDDWFPGYLDDIRIYNRALTEQEIQSLYHEGGWGYK